jgi:hypothetical protein
MQDDLAACCKNQGLSCILKLGYRSTMTIKIGILVQL